MYSNVSNVLVRVYPSTPHDYDREGRPQGGGCVPPTARSILVNAHLDSVSTSPGASDDALGCALMLATLRALLVSQHPPDYITSTARRSCTSWGPTASWRPTPGPRPCAT